MPITSEPTLALALGLDGAPMHEELADLAKSCLELDRRSRVGAALAPAFWRGIAKEIQGAVANELGDIPLSTVFIDAWLKAKELRSFADPMAHPRGESNVVPLVTHSISSTHTIQVDLLVNGVKKTTLALDVDLGFEIEAAHLRILDGRIRAISPGTVRVSASMRWKGRELKRFPLRTLQLPGDWTFDPGIALASTDRYALDAVKLPADARVPSAAPPPPP